MNIYKSILLGLILLSSVCEAKESSLVNLEIRSSFFRSKKIWGTYKGYRERSKIVKNKNSTKLISKEYHQLGHLVIKDGKFNFLRPLIIDGKTTIKMIELPYKKKKDIYSLDGIKHQKILYSIYQNSIESIIKSNYEVSKVNEEQIIFNDVICKKSKKYLHCNFHISFEKQKTDSPRLYQVESNELESKNQYILLNS